MPDEPMTLVERLRNPSWIGDPASGNTAILLEVDRTVAAMREAADLIEKLQRLAGAVSDGESFDEIRKLASAGAPLIDIQKR